MLQWLSVNLKHSLTMFLFYQRLFCLFLGSHQKIKSQNNERSKILRFKTQNVYYSMCNTSNDAYCKSNWNKSSHWSHLVLFSPSFLIVAKDILSGYFFKKSDILLHPPSSQQQQQQQEQYCGGQKNQSNYMELFSNLYSRVCYFILRASLITNSWHHVKRTDLPLTQKTKNGYQNKGCKGGKVQMRGRSWDEAGRDSPYTLAHFYFQWAVLVEHANIVDTHQHIIVPRWQLPFGGQSCYVACKGTKTQN